MSSARLFRGNSTRPQLWFPRHSRPAFVANGVFRAHSRDRPIQPVGVSQRTAARQAHFHCRNSLHAQGRWLKGGGGWVVGVRRRGDDGKSWAYKPPLSKNSFTPVPGVASDPSHPRPSIPAFRRWKRPVAPAEVGPTDADFQPKQSAAVGDRRRAVASPRIRFQSVWSRQNDIQRPGGRQSNKAGRVNTTKGEG